VRSPLECLRCCCIPGFVKQLHRRKTQDAIRKTQGDNPGEASDLELARRPASSSHMSTGSTYGALVYHAEVAELCLSRISADPSSSPPKLHGVCRHKLPMLGFAPRHTLQYAAHKVVKLWCRPGLENYYTSCIMLLTIDMVRVQVSMSHPLPAHQRLLALSRKLCRLFARVPTHQLISVPYHSRLSPRPYPCLPIIDLTLTSPPPLTAPRSTPRTL
jgi:hypothetical protein